MAQPSVRTGVDRHFEKCSPEVRVIYESILAAARTLGPVGEDPKKTSIHLTNRTAFAGIQTRREYLILTVKSDCDKKSDRIFKREQTSANRWHMELKLHTRKDVDSELKAWLHDAYEISS
jgi:uncharacterized protein DUF5655